MSGMRLAVGAKWQQTRAEHKAIARQIAEQPDTEPLLHAVFLLGVAFGYGRISDAIHDLGEETAADAEKLMAEDT